MISIIVAMANNRVIGHNNNMPWHLPRELQQFKSLTMGKPIIMGRNTYESLGKPLPGRHNIVITRQHDFTIPDGDVCHNIETAIELIQDADEAMIIGGASIYQQTLPLASKMYLTLIDLTVPGDVFFPQWDDSEWHCNYTMSYPADENNIHPYTCLRLDRR